MEQKLKLGYWNGPWKANPIRFCLEYCGAEYEEVRYEDGTKWFGADKQNLGFDFPNLPYLIDGDFKITESLNILSYIPYKYNKPELYGKDKDKFIQNEIRFICDELMTLGFTASQHDKAMSDEVYKTKIHPKLGYLKKFLGNKKYFLDYVTIADFVAYNIFKVLSVLNSAEMEQHKDWLKVYYENFENIPKIKEYIKSDRYLDYKPFGLVKFGYWEGAGKGNPIRLLLEYCGVPYEETRYSPQDRDKWFKEDKEKLGFDFPNLPYLIDGKIKITETLNILTYIPNKVKQLDLVGKGDDKYKQCEIRFMLDELLMKLYASLSKPEEEKKKDIETIFIPKLTYLKNFLGKKDFLLGYLTIVDFQFYNVCCGFQTKLETVWSQFKDDFTPFMKKFEELPKIKEYMASDKYLKWQK